MKYLLTGGAGFVGSNLTKIILDKGHSVVCIDNLRTGRKSNIENFLTNKNYRFIEGDVRDDKTIERLVFDSDRVFHLAAAVGVKFVLDNPLETILTNTMGTEILLAHASKHGKRIIVFSTSEVYGKNNKIPFKEEDDRIMGSTMKTRWSYATSKALDEFLALAYHKEKGLDVTIVRLFNTVGAGQLSEYGMVIPRFVKQALEGKNITVYGDGTQTRCFCNVKDVVKALYQLMETAESKGDIFNIGTDERISILSLANMIIEMTDSKSKIDVIPYEKVLGDDFEDMLHRVPDISKIKNLIGFSPSIKIQDTVKEVINFYS